MAFEWLGGFKMQLIVAGGIGGAVRSYINSVKNIRTWAGNIVVGAVIGYYWAPFIGLMFDGNSVLESGFALFLGIVALDFVVFVAATWKDVVIERLHLKENNDTSTSENNSANGER